MGAATAKRTRDHSRLVERAIERAAAAMALVPAPVNPNPCAPLAFTSPEARAAAEVEVFPFALGLAAPEPRDAWVAAARASVDSNLGWGPIVRRTVLGHDGVPVVLVGPLSAVRQAVPDRQTVKDWESVGVCLVPVLARYVEFAPGVFVGKAAYVPIADAPQVLQVEDELRGLAFEASL